MTTDSLRVLFLASTAEKSGGSFHSLLGMAAILSKQGRVVPYVILPDNGSAEDALKENEINYFVVRSYGAEWPLGAKRPLRQRWSHWKQRLQNRRAIKQISQYVKDKGIQLIHINTSVDEIGYYVAKRCHIPFVWHIREFVNEGLGLEFYSPRKQLRHIASADQVIAISNPLRERYATLLPNKPILMIHNGIDVNRFDLPRKDAGEGVLSLVSVGRVSKLKGHYDMVDALSDLEAQGMRSFHMTFVGTIDPELVSIVNKRGLGQRVSFTGFTDRVEEILTKSDVYLSGHPWEAFGRAAVEAMSAGCCVIGVDNAGTKDVITNGVTGFLYSPGNVGELVQLIKNCIDQPERRKAVAEAGRSFAREHFTIESCAENVFAVYQDVLKA